MTTSRKTQIGIDVVVSPTTQKTRVTQEGIDVVVTPTTQKARITQIGMDVVVANVAAPVGRSQVVIIG
jgi:hypothetical protein